MSITLNLKRLSYSTRAIHTATRRIDLIFLVHNLVQINNKFISPGTNHLFLSKVATKKPRTFQTISEILCQLRDLYICGFYNCGNFILSSKYQLTRCSGTQQLAVSSRQRKLKRIGVSISVTVFSSTQIHDHWAMESGKLKEVQSEKR